MRLAWFRATPPDSNALLDRTAPLVEALSRVHTLDVVTAAEANDFVWKHARQPYDLCVYEVDSSPAHRFARPYVLHYPGVAVLAEPTMPDVRMWGGSRVVVVSDAAIARSLASMWPVARLRAAALGSDVGAGSGLRASGFGPPGDYGLEASGTGRAPSPESGARSPRLTVGLLDPARLAVVERALARARQRGAVVTVITGATTAVLRQADVMVALEWPPAAGPPVAAIPALAAGRPLIVLEVEATAGWPALNPQTWQRRGVSPDPPIAVSVDPRDEEHSLMLAIVRLAGDAALRNDLGAAGHAWWRAHMTIDHAVAGWEAVLREAVTLDAAAPQQVADGSERAREILGEIGVVVDFLGSSA